MRRIAGALLAAAFFLRGAKGRPRPPETPQPDPSEREVGSKRWAEGAAIACMLLAALCGLAFPFLYVLADDKSTQWLGLSIGLALMFAAAGTIVAGQAGGAPREGRGGGAGLGPRGGGGGSRGGEGGGGGGGR